MAIATPSERPPRAAHDASEPSAKMACPAAAAYFSPAVCF
jgi:hypothetical protein